MTRLLLALFAFAGIASALPAQATIMVPGASVAQMAGASMALDVRYHHHHRRHHHDHPHA